MFRSLVSLLCPEGGIFLIFRILGKLKKKGRAHELSAPFILKHLYLVYSVHDVAYTANIVYTKLCTALLIQKGGGYDNQEVCQLRRNLPWVLCWSLLWGRFSRIRDKYSNWYSEFKIQNTKFKIVIEVSKLVQNVSKG